MIDFTKLKSIDDFNELLPPIEIPYDCHPVCPYDEQMILRMLVRPKYSNEFFIPPVLSWLAPTIKNFYHYDTAITSIHHKWAYVTVRHGIEKEPDTEWHLDGGSLRVELIPERNYIWVSDDGIEYKTGNVIFHDGFDPVKQNLFKYMLDNIRDEKDFIAPGKKWNLIHPFVFHRKSPTVVGTHRTFVRITFPDIEIRDVNCTQNPLLPTNAFGRDPVKSFRDRLR